MSLWTRILTGIFGPLDDRSVEEAEADYIAAKQLYDACVSKRDTRGQGHALKELNTALNHMLRVHYDAKSVSVPSRGVSA